jgi:hypothetical protein
MTRALRCGSLIGVLMVGLACGTERPTAPSAVPTSPTTTQPPLPPTRPPPPQPSGEPVATYVFNGPLDYAIRGFTTGSQYLLYENGMFGLRYDAFGHVYLGAYRQDNATITFLFHASTGDRVDATGTLKGDLIEVRYSEIMQHSDFENAVHRRVQ